LDSVNHYGVHYHSLDDGVAEIEQERQRTWVRLRTMGLEQRIYRRGRLSVVVARSTSYHSFLVLSSGYDVMVASVPWVNASITLF